MNMLSKTTTLVIAVLLFAGSTAFAQTAIPKKDVKLKTYLIERDIPNAGKLTPAELKGISQKSCSVL